MPDVSVSRSINASADQLWGMVSDVTRMGEWSPETTGAAWLGSASGPAVGAKFKGTNAAGDKSWSTTCVVTECEPGASFVFQVRGGGMPVAEWGYRFVSTDEGTEVTETWTDQRNWLLLKLSKKVSGIADRAAHNRATMQSTLDRLAAAAATAAT